MEGGEGEEQYGGVEKVEKERAKWYDRRGNRGNDVSIDRGEEGWSDGRGKCIILMMMERGN